MIHRYNSLLYVSHCHDADILHTAYILGLPENICYYRHDSATGGGICTPDMNVDTSLNIADCRYISRIGPCITAMPHDNILLSR